MVYFTIIRDSRRLYFCMPGFGKGPAPMDVLFYSTECIVAQREGEGLLLFYVRKIKSESDASISGYMIRGEDEL